ncbi:MAG: hypothetical protein LBO80_07745 [Treponema sp.]|nr:hypothetical protein [Treponema sp.]
MVIQVLPPIWFLFFAAAVLLLSAAAFFCAGPAVRWTGKPTKRDNLKGHEEG